MIRSLSIFLAGVGVPFMAGMSHGKGLPVTMTSVNLESTVAVLAAQVAQVPYDIKLAKMSYRQYVPYREPWYGSGRKGISVAKEKKHIAQLEHLYLGLLSGMSYTVGYMVGKSSE